MSKSAVERPVDRPEQTIAGTLRRHGRHIMANWIRELALLPVIVLLLVIGAFVNPAFLTADNFINVAQESAALGAVVAAESLILLTGKFDLSVQATYGLAPMVGAWLIVSKDGQGLGTNWNPFLGIAIVLLVGLAVGAFNGFLVIKLGFNAFIFTLAVLILLTGIQVGIVSGRTIYHLPDAYIYLGSQYLLGVPVSVWVTGAIFLLAAVFLRYHRVGRAIYAIGGNTEAARAAGIHVDRVRIGVFIVASLLAALPAPRLFLFCGRAVLGGPPRLGGRGGWVGPPPGVFLGARGGGPATLPQSRPSGIGEGPGLSWPGGGKRPLVGAPTIRPRP